MNLLLHLHYSMLFVTKGTHSRIVALLLSYSALSYCIVVLKRLIFLYTSLLYMLFPLYKTALLQAFPLRHLSFWPLLIRFLL